MFGFGTAVTVKAVEEVVDDREQLILHEPEGKDPRHPGRLTLGEVAYAENVEKLHDAEVLAKQLQFQISLYDVEMSGVCGYNNLVDRLHEARNKCLHYEQELEPIRQKMAKERDQLEKDLRKTETWEVCLLLRCQLNAAIETERQAEQERRTAEAKRNQAGRQKNTLMPQLRDANVQSMASGNPSIYEMKG